MNYIYGTGVLVPLVGFLIYKWRARVDIETKKAMVQIDAGAQAQSLPLSLLKDELGKRETELAQLRIQDKAEREQYLATLLSMKVALEEIVTDLRAHREEERQRSANMHERLDVVDDRLLVIETKLGVQKPS